MASILSRLVAWIAPLVLFVFSGLTQAAVVLQVDSSGQLTGATGVVVDGLTYDVQFGDGSCMALFSGCDAPADFVFTTEASALAAAQALLDHVFVNSPAGNFDGPPNADATAGCRLSSGGCAAATPYQFHTESFVLVSFARNGTSTDVDQIGSGRIVRQDDYVSTGTLTYARWSVHQESEIPEPGSLALIAAAGLGLLGLRRRAIAKR